MALLRYRLVNVEGLSSLYSTRLGVIRLDQITDFEAEHLVAAGSRYVQELEPEPATEPPAEPVPKPPRKARQAK